ncbi:hypothetical protein ONZ43_g5011 [Nemania bipapillata]|uniref:Uncharacterized protein n=1 Tax=Nemania bipapillata TaxID=110536 RepID=A0ACC2IFS6_9PEZI|nr:hypothetical protein ONZ43_g5011 [Nemania bipapillata]
MRLKTILLPAFLAAYPSSGACEDAITAQQEQPPSNSALPVFATADANNHFTMPRTIDAEPLVPIPASQHIIAARTTSSVPILITTLPTPSSPSDAGETGSISSVENTSTTTITITSRSTTTIRPTLTITTLFSSIGPTTSGADRCLVPLTLWSWE